MTEKLNIYQRINEVRRQVQYLKKDGRVKVRTKGGNEFEYFAITHDAVTAAIREAMVDQGILCIPRVTSWRQEETRTLLDMTAEFLCDDNPDSNFYVDGYAIGDDFGDKGPGKAMSYAVKNIYLKVFMLETGESDESRTGVQTRDTSLTAAIIELSDSIKAIKEGIASGDLSSACEAWSELSDDEKRAIWVAPSKGGPFTTAERKVMQSKEFREAFNPGATEGGEIAEEPPK